MQQMDLSSEEVIDRMACIVDLTIPLDARAGVLLAFGALAKAAAEIADFALSVEVEADPVIVR
jgi:hypothetical protein